MGRKTKRRALALWANGQRVGLWLIPPRNEMSLQYDADWVQSAAGRPLSLSLPFTIGNVPLRGARVLNYFDNLLPDSEAIRRRLARRFHTESTEAFELLQSIGRDCVGALQLLPEDDQPLGFDQIDGIPLNDEAIEKHVLTISATGTVMGRHDDSDDDFRISIAGAHEKTALLWHQNQWMRPLGATPTTHILKLPLGMVGLDGRVDMSTSVENEWLCSRILHAYGLPVAHCEIADFGKQRVLVVERFDRRMHSSGTWWLRLPQEDFCQASGLPPSQKYETDGGPGAQAITRILQRSEAPAKDIEVFMSAMVLFWLLAATDGHAKNFSLQIQAGGRYQLAPLYDVLSIWPVEGPGAHQFTLHKAKLAMGVPGKSKHYRLKEIQRRHFNHMATLCGYGHDAERLIKGIIEKTPYVLARVNSELPNGFPAQVADSILGHLEKSVKRLAAMPEI